MSVDSDKLKDILLKEVETRLALKKAKGKAFLLYTEKGIKLSEIWQRIAVHPQIEQLEKDWELANIDKMLAVYSVNGKIITEIQDSEEFDL